LSDFPVSKTKQAKNEAQHVCFQGITCTEAVCSAKQVVMKINFTTV